MFRDALAVFAESAERNGLVDEEPELEFALEINHLIQGTHLARVQVDWLHDQKLPANFGRFGMLKMIFFVEKAFILNFLGM